MTITTDVRRSTFSWRSRSRIMRPFAESRLPVGSSASSSLRLGDDRHAPPRRAAVHRRTARSGSAATPRARPRPASGCPRCAAAPLWPRSPGCARAARRRCAPRSARGSRLSSGRWKPIEAQAATHCARARTSTRRSRPSNRTRLRCEGSSRPATRFGTVLLPRPLGPTMDTNSPSGTDSAKPVERRPPRPGLCRRSYRLLRGRRPGS